jgi:hypothetical protein
MLTILNSNTSLIDGLQIAACAVVARCGERNREEQSLCASWLLGAPLQGTLAQWFSIAYQTELNSRAEQREPSNVSRLGLGEPV